MDKAPYLNLAKIFNEHGYRLYIVGGATRAYLLDKDCSDYDVVTDATPEQIKEFLPNANYTFAKFGSVRLKDGPINFDITTMRIEGDYKDYRHPGFVKYVKDLKQDYVRRDFTINAVYLDENFQIIDYCGGVKDLEDGIIRFVGDPATRIKEDPLRIIRAERFQKKLGFQFEIETLKAMKSLYELLDELNPQKVAEERRKSQK